MAPAQGKDGGKSAFVKDYLAAHPAAGTGAIAAAWQEAGNAGTISSGLVSKVRKDLGLTGRGTAAGKSRTKGTAGRRSSAAATSDVGGGTAAREDGGRVMAEVERPAASPAAGGDRAGVLIRLEGAIDGLLHEIKTVGGHPEFEEALRKARRILVRSHGE